MYHSADSPGSAQDFHICDNLKGNFQSVALRDRDSLLSAITEIFSDTRQDDFVAVYQNWMTRLHYVIKNGGQ
jgi:hypothetical protein